MTEPTQDPAGPGALLRAAREKQGLHIAALAAAIKVSPRKLDALEHDRWSELPDATFARALAQTVCRTLKVDPRPVLDKLPPATPALLEAQDGGLNTPFRDRPGRDEPGLGMSAVKPMIVGAAVLMALAVVVYLLPADLLQRSPAAASAPSAVAQAASAAMAVQAADAASAAESASVAASAAMAPAFMPDAASAPAAGEPVFVAPPPAASAPTAASPVAVPIATAPAVPLATAPAVKPAASLLQLRTTQSSWVEVRDGRGNALLSRIVTAGENVALDGALPIRLTIGNAAATQLVFKGQAVDLAPRSRDNVARVELQ